MSAPPFRNEALEAAEHVGDVQRTMRVTEPATRIASLALVGGVLGTLAWSYFVWVPVHVTAQGVLVYSEQTVVRQVKVPFGGFVADVRVQAGETVATGDVVATLNLPDRSAELEQQRRALTEKRLDVEALRKLQDLDNKAEAQSLEQRQAASRTRIDSLNERLKWLDKRLVNLEALLERGVVTAVEVAQARVARAEVVDNLASVKADLVGLTVDNETAVSQRERDALAEALELQQLEGRVRRLEETLKQDSTIKADANGIVASVNTNVGALVATGDTLIEIEPLGSGPRPRLEAAVFIALNDGKRVETGDKARLTPADQPTVDRSQLLGDVRFVSAVPASEAALREEIGDGPLVREILDAGPTFAARISLEAPPDDPNAYVWTSRGEAPAVLSVSTPVETKITVDHVRLLSLAIPSIRQLLEGRSGPAGNDR